MIVPLRGTIQIKRKLNFFVTSSEVFHPHKLIGNSVFTKTIKNSITLDLPLYLAPNPFHQIWSCILLIPSH